MQSKSCVCQKNLAKPSSVDVYSITYIFRINMDLCVTKKHLHESGIVFHDLSNIGGKTNSSGNSFVYFIFIHTRQSSLYFAVIIWPIVRNRNYFLRTFCYFAILHINFAFCNYLFKKIIFNFFFYSRFYFVLFCVAKWTIEFVFACNIERKHIITSILCIHKKNPICI